MINDKYKQQVSLLLEVLPYISQIKDFALKGGTALNLFYLDMPRLSVDIDLCYLPIEDRKSTFSSIHGLLKEIQNNLKKNLQCKVRSTFPLNGQREAKLLIERNGTQIKIEPNYILRRSLLGPVEKQISKTVSETFKVDVQCLCLREADLYGGKICAALDRQHPRDLFDIFLFLKHKTWDRSVINAFLAYLISHNRPFP